MGKTRTVGDGAYLVITWEPERPRETVRVDGFYFVEVLAQKVLASEREAGRQGMMLVVMGRAETQIPDALFYEPH